MPHKGCPTCHQNTWLTCPKCGGYVCRGCGKDSNGKKRTANNHCTYCDYIGAGWRSPNKTPSWATY